MKKARPSPARKLLQCLGWLYDGAVNGIPGVDGLEELAQSYSTRDWCTDDAIDRLINWQGAKAGAAGFITGVGGMLTLSVAIPANLAGVLPVLGDDPVAVENRRLITAAAKAGFTVNLSADNLAHADRLAELGISPVVTVLARAYARKAVRHRFKRRRDEWSETIGEWRDHTASLPRYSPAGRRIAICPATYSDATCKTCGACANARDAVIGFPAHGAWRQVAAATAARDVPAGESRVFHDHRTMAEVIAGETEAA